MRNFIFISLLLFIQFVTRCATTSLSSIMNSNYYNCRIERVMVVALFSDLGYRKTAEENFVKKLPCDAWCSVNIMPPFKDYTSEEIEKILKFYHIDGILMITLEDFWTSETYVPKSYEEEGSAYFSGDYLKYKATTKESGGYYISKPRVKFDIRLHDAKSGEIIWMTTSTTKGNAFANFGTLINSLAASVAKELHQRGIFRK